MLSQENWYQYESNWQKAAQIRTQFQITHSCNNHKLERLDFFFVEFWLAHNISDTYSEINHLNIFVLAIRRSVQCQQAFYTRTIDAKKYLSIILHTSLRIHTHWYKIVLFIMVLRWWSWWIMVAEDACPYAYTHTSPAAKHHNQNQRMETTNLRGDFLSVCQPVFALSNNVAVRHRRVNVWYVFVLDIDLQRKRIIYAHINLK